MREVDEKTKPRGRGVPKAFLQDLDRAQGLGWPGVRYLERGL